jgi:lysophospholipid acyltransferase (LPLAT)-like uncharacterized protein
LKPPDSDKLYSFASLAAYSPRERLLIRAADLAFYSLIRTIGSTVSFEVEGAEQLDSIKAAGRTPIYATWHDRIFLGTYFLKQQGIVFLTSQSFDGEYIARFLQRFGFGAIRGSSTRGGARGLVQMIREMKRGIPMGFTVDGPRGPRYVAKSGPIALAAKTGQPIVPFIVEPSKLRTVGSWDKLQIPMPFSRAKVIFGLPIDVPLMAEIDGKLAELQISLEGLTERGRVWRENV